MVPFGEGIMQRACWLVVGAGSGALVEALVTTRPTVHESPVTRSSASIAVAPWLVPPQRASSST